MDAAPKKSGRGGRRAGAGRKRKDAVSATALPALELKAALTAPAPEQVEPLAARYVHLALEALFNILVNGKSDAQKVAAAEEVLDRGWGKPTVDSGGDQMLPFFGTAPARELPSEVRTACRRLTDLAVQVLRNVADRSASEAARIRAIKALFNRGLGAVAPARVEVEDATVVLGKKAEAERVAQNPDTASPMGRLLAARADQLAAGAAKPLPN